MVNMIARFCNLDRIIISYPRVPVLTSICLKVVGGRPQLRDLFYKGSPAHFNLCFLRSSAGQSNICLLPHINSIELIVNFNRMHNFPV